ncbi:MAG: winged helix-turn-helix transcriptional regulator [Dehalococcoidia bacterium]|nr:winged helix-turn-helix transcriptional regulator [Dehalococcoidia bacterium]
MREVLKVFKALSDETRLRILNLVLEQECCVCEVVQAMQISQTRASRNLGILHDAGLLKARRNGLWVLYSMDEEAMEKKSCAGLAEVIRTAMENDELAALDRERLKTAVREGPCSRWVFA